MRNNSSHTVIQCSESIFNLFLRLGDFLGQWLPTYFILASLLLLLIASLIKREIRHRKDCWLFSRVERAKNELKGKRLLISWHKKPLRYISQLQLYYPTLSNLVFIVLTMAIVFSFCNKCFWIPYEKAEFYRSLVPIQIGIVTLIFPVMIFIIGFSGNKMASGASLSEVLLKESYLFPVGIAGLLFLVNLIWARSSYVVIAQILFSALMYACVLFRVVRLLLNDKRLLEKSKTLLKDKLKRSIEKTIEERLGNNILMKELGENKIELQYSFFDSVRNSEEYVQYGIKQRGKIININLANLDRIAKIIESASRRSGFSFYKNVLDLSSDANKDIITLQSGGVEAQTFKEDKNRYLRKQFMDLVTDENPYVLSFKKELFSEQSVFDEIKDLVGKTFVVRKEKEDEDKLRIELRNLKDQLIDDIRNKHLGRISNLKEVYIALAELFLDIMKSYSSNYSMEMARKERSNIVGEWVEVQWLTDDLRDIYEVAMESHDRNIIREIGYLPFAIAHRAIKRLDHYIFEKTFGFLSIFYMHALREKDKDLQSFMKERCGSYLKETADYAVQYELDKIELGEDRVRQFRDFAVEIFLQLLHLLKQSYDAKDLEVFRDFVLIGNKLFSHFHPSEDHLDADHYRWQLKLPDLSADEKKKVENQLKKREFLEGIEKEIQQKKKEMFFGLASFVLDEYRNNKQNKDTLEYFRVISAGLPSDFKELTSIFLACHNFDIEHFWGWDWWILQNDGEVHSIDFLGKIIFLYCVKSLQIVNTINDQALEKIGLPHNRDFVHMIENDDSIIRKTIAELIKEFEQWGGIVPSIEVAKKNALFKVFDLAKEKQVREEEDFLINSKLSQAKLAEFVKGFLDDYRGNCGVHTLFEKFGEYEDKTKPAYKGTQKSMGYNRLDEKGAFVEGWYVHYSRWGEQYGSGIATSENNHLFEQLCGQLVPKQVTADSIISQIEVAIQGLNDKKYSPNVVITSLDFDDYRLMSSDNRFIPHWHKDCPKKNIPHFYGVLRLQSGELPVIRLYREKIKGVIGIFDLKRFATLIQLNPIDEEKESQYLQEQFYIRVLDLNEDNENRNNIILAAPEWLNKYSDKERYLKTKVIVKTFMRQELCIKDKEAGVILKTTNDEKEEEAEGQDNE